MLNIILLISLRSRDHMGWEYLPPLPLEATLTGKYSLSGEHFLPVSQPITLPYA